MYFLLYRSIGNSEKDLQNCSREQWTFSANYACACETVVEIRTPVIKFSCISHLEKKKKEKKNHKPFHTTLCLAPRPKLNRAWPIRDTGYERVCPSATSPKGIDRGQEGLERHPSWILN